MSKLKPKLNEKLTNQSASVTHFISKQSNPSLLPAKHITPRETAQTTGDNIPAKMTDNRKCTEPWLTQYTAWTFNDLHAQVFRIIDYITQQSIYRDHPFTAKWRTLKDNVKNKYPMTATTSWRNIKLLLQIEELSEYREFIIQCPVLETYVHMKAKGKSTIEFGIIRPLETTNVINQEEEKNKTDQRRNTEVDKHDMEAVLNTIIPALKRYIDRHDDEYADLCDSWFDQGLTEKSTWENIKAICNIVSAEDFYMLLKVSPALQKGYNIQKEKGKISVVHTHLTPEESEYDGEMMLTLVLSNADWEQLHKHVFQTVTKWANAQKLNHLAMAWRTAIREGLTENSTWDEATTLLLATTYAEYSCYLTACIELQQKMKIHVDPDLYLLGYGFLDEDKPSEYPNTVSVQNTPVTSNTGDTKPKVELIDTSIQMPTLEQPGDDEIEQQDHWEPIHPTDNWAFVNAMIATTMEDWAQEPQNKQHAFHTIYQHIKFNGYTKHIGWEKASSILHIQNIKEYISFVNQCPVVFQLYELTWDPNKETIRYKWKNNPNVKDLKRETDIIKSTYAYMKTLAFDFDKKIQKMKNLLNSTNTDLVRYQHSIDTQVTQGNNNITNHTATKMREMTKVTDEHIAKHGNALRESYEKYKTQLDESISMGIIKLQDQYEQMEKALETTIESALNYAENEMTSLKNTIIDNIEKHKKPPIGPDQQGHEPRRNPRFPNVDYKAIAKIQKPKNPYALDEEHTQASEEEEWGRFGPAEAPTTHDRPIPLPQLMPYKLVNHVKVPYTGKDASYTWYYTFRSAVQQYGVLLIPIENFKKDKSLCPMKYYGTKVDRLRYKDMADALYQLLQLPEIIPLEHTEVRNILHHHASNTDGYSALYEIMERIHPHLNPDAKLSPPQSINCSDIHEYYNQLTAYFLHNSFEKVHFNPRRQVNIFLEGLDQSFAPAILQIRQLLRTWKDEEQPPEDLKLTSLPRTVERIMQEQNTFPTVRALTQHGRNSNQRVQGMTSITQGRFQTRPFQNIQCSYCKLFGHKRANCDKMAQYIILQEAYKNLDDKTKARILDNYAKANEERRNRKIQKVKGTVRQLYSEGYDDEADALWDQCHSLEGTYDTDSDSSSAPE